MKSNFSTIFAVAAAVFCLASCKKDKEPIYPSYEAIVTVKTDASSECYLQLNNTTTLKPDNWSKSPFTEQTRAYVIYADKGPTAEGSKYNRTVSVEAYEKILTKQPVVTKGSKELDDAAYGKAGISINYNWATNVEDDYLTINFAGYWGITGKTHYINLVTGTDPSDPYTLVLRHDANGDDMGEARFVRGLAAFDLRSLPDTKGESVKLTLKYTNLDGIDRTETFSWCSGSGKLRAGSGAYEAAR